VKKQKNMRILWWLDYVLSAQCFSGVQNVALHAGKALGSRAKVDFVKWDNIEGQPRYLSKNDLTDIYGDHQFSANKFSQKRNYKFWDTVQSDGSVWLFVPEIPFHIPDGNMKFSKLISQCRENKVKVATIYYDIIPLRLKEYAEIFSQHLDYTFQVLRTDAIICISEFTKKDLLAYIQQKSKEIGSDTIRQVAEKTITIPICGDQNYKIQNQINIRPKINTILLIGTIEPRKQQTRFLKIFNNLIKKNKDLAAFKIKLYGSLHPDSFHDLEVELKKNRNINYYRYSKKEVISAAYTDATFSVFISKYEGFGLPIIESLQNGVPCLTGNHGSLKEVAEGGGCVMVDVNDDQAIADGIIKLTSHNEMTNDLRSQISKRKFRNWDNYATDIVQYIGKQNKTENRWGKKINACCKKWISKSSQSSVDLCRVDLTNIIYFNFEPKLLDQFKSICQSKKLDNLKVTQLSKSVIKKISGKHLQIVLSSNILILPSQKDFRFIQKLASVYRLGITFPPTILFLMQDIKLIYKRIYERFVKVNNALKIAQNESSYADLVKIGSPQLQKFKLAIVLSTYNRAKFVSLNVAWLMNCINKYHPNVLCVVVDNASQDNTEEELERFKGHPNFYYICNPQNVGMLGNLRVCSSLNLALYTWIIGDDDFIHPNAIERTLDVISKNPSIPLIIHNFSVYFRTKVNNLDSAKGYILESNMVGQNCDDSGLLLVNKIAEQHDNLFTAIYPIVFRHDIASACFNYPFDGKPFHSLTESVPTSKIILGSYPFVKGFWFKEIGIAGNAHNSWAVHRPRWHLVIMPQVLELAKNAGVDSEKIWRWMQVQFELFRESIKIAKSNKTSLDLNTQEITVAKINFRQNICATRLVIKSRSA
jgi:glycosyltransferase involved in cell wall biosynthesis